MGSRSKIQDIKHELHKFLSWNYLTGLVVNPAQLPFVAYLIILSELILNVLIVEKVPYTEIDWKAYMQECEGFLNGTLDYSKLRGDTGPFLILALIEFCWNTYPSTNVTSAMLHICHISILYGVYKKMSTELKMASKVQ
ncbi:unnamed protein product [Euphydryas editha]|uniref:dolichyl-P-Man:Man5GlcNAc2-PP-dolichol alpha-1,3-mannosyltransferase n=1 Tax=Euphydryas editha TaxID=104508 RepID=A0AAU9UNR9_EUPED|nr:unnamed protein product [Euphydryas editha]